MVILLSKDCDDEKKIATNFISPNNKKTCDIFSDTFKQQKKTHLSFDSSNTIFSFEIILLKMSRKCDKKKLNKQICEAIEIGKKTQNTQHAEARGSRAREKI